MGLDPPYNSFI